LKAQDELPAARNKELANILDATQRKRLTQIDRQLARQSEFALGTAFGKELGVTDAQRKKYEEVMVTHGEAVAKAVLSGEPFEKVKEAVAAVVKDHEKAIAAILTADQQAMKKELLGPAFTGQTMPDQLSIFRERANPPVPRTLSFGRYVTELSVLTRAAGVRDELKLTDGQIRKLSEVTRDHATKFPALANPRNVQDSEQMQKLFADRSGFVEKVLTDVLTKEQQARFAEHGQDVLVTVVREITVPLRDDDQIEKILVEQKVLEALDQWLVMARMAARIQYRDKAFQ
jgi:hypothetical protein